MTNYGKSLLPATVGFDRLFSTLDEFDRMINNNFKPATYPPYNLIKLDETNYELQIAVAGFSVEDIDIEVKENKVTITGKQPKTPTTGTYVHRGLGTRDFTNDIWVADTTVVRSATIKNGILSISLENIIPEERKPKKIPIMTDQKLLTEKA